MENENKTIDPTIEKAGTVSKEANRKYINTIVGVGLLTAVVVVLQLLSSVIKFGPFSITLALTAIIVGGAVYGIWAGAWLGCTMALTVLISGDAAFFMSLDPFGTVLTVILKSTVAGLLAAIVYKALEKKNRYVSVVAAGITAPVVNTGIFLIGCFLFFMDTISEWARGMDLPVWEYIITSLIGLNFPIELAVNLALSTVTVTVIGIAKKSMTQH